MKVRAVSVLHCYSVLTSFKCHPLANFYIGNEAPSIMGCRFVIVLRPCRWQHRSKFKVKCQIRKMKASGHQRPESCASHRHNGPAHSNNTTQITPCSTQLFMEPKVSLPCSQEPALVPILSQMNPFLPPHTPST
jgi:hypothetical protein